MIEAIKEALNDLDKLTFGMGHTFLMMPVLSLGLSLMFKIVRLICQEEWTPIQDKQNQGEQVRDEQPKISLEKEETDSDLKKYFDYKVR